MYDRVVVKGNKHDGTRNLNTSSRGLVPACDRNIRLILNMT
jgi:hypothetical protein